jgi:hypothetical protein
MFFPVSAWFTAFLVTVAVEGPIVWWCVRGQEASVLRVGTAVLLANLASHPAVWFIFTQLLLVGTATFTLTTEAWAVLVEAVLYVLALRTVGPRRALAASLVANAASYLVGVLVGRFLWPGLF